MPDNEELDEFGLYHPIVVKAVSKSSELDKKKNRMAAIIVMLFNCRNAHHVSECAECDYWSENGEHFTDDCVCHDEHKEFEQTSHELKVRLDLSSIGLPRSIRDQIIG